MQKDKIAIYGASGFGREVAWLCETSGAEVVCFIDDDTKKIGSKQNDILVLSLDEAAHKYPGIGLVVAIGNPIFREKITETGIKNGFECKTIIHPDVEMSNRVKMGTGVVICAGNILTTDIGLGDHVQVNLNCTIGHDVIIGDYTTLSPGVNVSGWVHFGKRVYVGTGAVFVNGTEDSPLKIGNDVIVGAGACVIKSIDSGVWGGVPARDLHPSNKHFL